MKAEHLEELAWDYIADNTEEGSHFEISDFELFHELLDENGYPSLVNDEYSQEDKNLEEYLTVLFNDDVRLVAWGDICMDNDEEALEFTFIHEFFNAVHAPLNQVHIKTAIEMANIILKDKGMPFKIEEHEQLVLLEPHESTEDIWSYQYWQIVEA